MEIIYILASFILFNICCNIFTYYILLILILIKFFINKKDENKKELLEFIEVMIFIFGFTVILETMFLIFTSIIHVLFQFLSYITSF